MLDFDVAKGDYSKLQGMNPFKSIAVPRPIGWISTVSKNGVDNLAPYSQFCNVGFDPPYVMSLRSQESTSQERILLSMRRTWAVSSTTWSLMT